MRSSEWEDRWYALRPHPVQQERWKCTARFQTNPAGRRSGKTELAKREGIILATEDTRGLLPHPWYVFAAPTRDQAKLIFWDDLKVLTPPWMVSDISESTLTITLKHGPQISVVGLDKPQRIEGRPLDWICIDEMGSMKEHVWGRHVRPALSTDGRPGMARLIGVPRGRNHYYRLWRASISDQAELDGWRGFTWHSADILPPEEIEAAKRDLDELTFQQEYEASFLNYEGRAYYPFDRNIHANEKLPYRPDQPLIVTHDFNVAPGTAGICQEYFYEGVNPLVPKDQLVTMVVGEVWQRQNSNTPRVGREVADRYAEHQGPIYVYGDASGGARKTTNVSGNDWDILKHIYRAQWGERVLFRVPRCNPPERVRVNAVNSRLRSMDGKVRKLIDPVAAPQHCEDFDGVTIIEGGSGEIDKSSDRERTHLTDGHGYFDVRAHPLVAVVSVHDVGAY